MIADEACRSSHVQPRRDAYRSRRHDAFVQLDFGGRYATFAANGGFYIQASSGLVTRPAAGNDYKGFE